MSEKPILFSGEMVRAILDGRKSQTRRIVKPEIAKDLDAIRPLSEIAGGYHEVKCGETSRLVGTPPMFIDGGDPTAWEGVTALSPISVGDTLWVRETWAPISEFDPSPETGVLYRADPMFDGMETFDWKWRPSIHMPRWACRLRLNVTGVRVERLQDISQEDAIAEGSPRSHSSIDGVSRNFGFPDFSRSWFAQLWQSINGPESWAENPWVWVYEFERKDDK